jgi:hypothetical protein
MVLQQAYDNMNAAVVHIKKSAREVVQRFEDYNDLLSDVLISSNKVARAITDLDGLLCSASRVSTQWSATRCAATRRSLRLSGRRAGLLVGSALAASSSVATTTPSFCTLAGGHLHAAQTSVVGPVSAASTSAVTTTPS